jgi:DNA-binding response OmpR family regulator
MSQGKKPTILLLEADASLRRLIALGLQHRGVHVIEVSSAEHVSSLGIQSLDLLILDIDGGLHSDWSLVEAAQSHPYFTDVPAIVLSWDCLVPSNSAMLTRTSATTLTQVTCLTKPFDARTLYATIEQILAARAAREAAAVAKAEEMLLATYSAQASPSIWPIITAAGVLLTFIGMMLQIAVTIVGLLIVIIALLLWTLGTKPGREMAVG